MPRHNFGGSLPDWSFSSVTAGGEDDLVKLLAGATITFWNSAAGGTQYVDLLAGGDPVDHVLSSDGTDGYALGTIPEFSGPDDIWWMWADGGTGSRHVIVAWDIGDYVAQVITQADSNAAGLSSHLSAVNPHAMVLGDLDNVSTVGASSGQVLGLSGGLWVATSIEGLTDVVTLNSEQTITARKFMTNPLADTPDVLDNSALIMEVIPGQVADLMRCRTPNRERVTYINEHGELRVIAREPNTVAVRFKQRSGAQTADLTQWTDQSNNVLARVDAIGRVHGINTMNAPWLMSVSGAQVEVGQGVSRIYNDTTGALIITSVRASAGVAPTGDDIVIDINKNGVSILPDELVIPAGQHTTGRVTAISVTTIAPGEYITMDIDQLGSSVAGDHIVVQIQVS